MNIEWQKRYQWLFLMGLHETSIIKYHFNATSYRYRSRNVALGVYYAYKRGWYNE